VDTEELRRIIRILKEEGLSEITVWNKDRRITVRQGGQIAESAALRDTARATAGDEGSFTVNAPLLGTFYLRSGPDEESFVSEGDEVAPGDTLCIIEAMKVMNEIKAEAAGKLKKILIDDGKPVQYGQPLFVFEQT
jgi:acetyl-CoA carboxylase biotin carboxyl carrier protein